MNLSDNFSSTGLNTAFDINAVLTLLNEALKKNHPHIDIIDGKISDVKSDSSGQYVLLYSFKLQNNLTNRTRKQLMTARVLTETEPLPREASIDELNRYRSIENLWIQMPIIFLPSPKIVFYPFPNDTAFPWLIDTVDTATMKKQFKSN